MSAKVVDTNVLIVANGTAEQASLECCSCCIAALQDVRQQRAVVDDSFLIFGEYQHEVSPSGQPGAGDAFLLWLFRHRSNPDHCESVTLTPNGNSFDEFPDDPDLITFDPSDHKFVAVANASVNMPNILNAVDSDWWIHQKVLKRNRIEIVHLCEEQIALWKAAKTQK